MAQREGALSLSLSRSLCAIKNINEMAIEEPRIQMPRAISFLHANISRNRRNERRTEKGKALWV